MADPASEPLPKTFRGGGYEVTVNSDRSIRVRSGDWLSKYSAAIYGNFDHVGEFYRKSGENWIDIVNKNAITAGETLYWLPKGKPAVGGPGINPPVGGAPGVIVPDDSLKSENAAKFLRWIYDRFIYTDWRLDGSSGGDLSFSIVTVQYANLVVEQISTQQKTSFHAMAGGLGFGFPTEGFTFGGSFSLPIPPFKSYGTIVKFAWVRELLLEDFRWGIVVLEFGGNAIAGVSFSLVVFGIHFPVLLVEAIYQYFRDGNLNALETKFRGAMPKGVIIMGGGIVGVPGISVAGRAGVMYDPF